MRISDWSSDVCSSDLLRQRQSQPQRKTWRTKILASRGISRSLFNARNLDRRLLRSRAGGCYELVDEDIKAALQSLNPSLFIRLCIREVQIGRASCRERVCQYV